VTLSVGLKAIFSCCTAAFATKYQRLMFHFFRDLICERAKEDNVEIKAFFVSPFRHFWTKRNG
jgi:hypothetical protein